MAEPGTRFYRKTNVLYDTELNAVYKDLPHGSNTTIDIKGGRDPSFNMLDVKVSPKPVFGDGQIDQLRLNLYGDSITTNTNATLINLAAYKIKKGNELGDNEGNFTLGTKDITVFGAYYGNSWLEEGFDRTISQEDLDGKFESIGITITKKTDPYILLQDAWDNMEGNVGSGAAGTKEKLFENYGTELEGVGRVIFVEKANWRLGEYMPKNGRSSWRNDPTWYESDTWLNVKKVRKVYHTNDVQLEADVNPKQITPFNSIFDQKRTDNGYFEAKNNDGTPNYIAFGDVLQTTEKVASSGTSAVFDMIWKADSGDGVVGGDLKVRDHYPARCIANTATMGTNSNSDGTISGPRGRQETYISKKDIPIPIRTQSGNYSSNNSGDCMFDASIELDMNFDALEFAHTAVFTNSGGGDGGSDGDGGRGPSSGWPQAGSPVHATLRRSIVFAMTDEEPDETQDLFTFLSQNYCHNWSISSHTRTASDGTSGTTHTTFTVVTTGPCGNVNNTLKGSIAVGDRVYFSHCNSQWLNHDNTSHSDGTSRYPQNGFIVTNVTTSTVTVDVKDSADDPAVSTNTANSHSDQHGFGTVFKYSNKNFYGMAFLNMSGKTPDWANMNTSTPPTYYHLSTGQNTRHVFETNHKGIIPLPFTGRSVDNSNLVGSGTLDHGLTHSWVPNATTQDFVHGCQSYGDYNNEYVDRWYNRLDTSTWYTLGFHWNPNSGKCHFMVNPVGKTSDDDYLTFDSTSGDKTHPDNGNFMPNMKANTNGKLHGNYARDTSPDNWPSNMTIWGSNCSFHNQEEQSLYELNYQHATAAVSTGGTTTTATPWWMGIEDSEVGYEDGKERDTKTKVFLDKVKFNGFNLTHDNATVSLNNQSRKPIKFYNGETPIKMSTHYNYVSEAMSSGFKPNITQVAFGFDNRNDIESAARYMLFNDFTTDNISNINSLDDGTNLHIGFTSDELNGHQIAALNEDGTLTLTCTRDGDNTPVVDGTSDNSDNRHIRVGQKVTGTGLDTDVYVTAVGDATSPTTFTISEDATGSGNAVWTFSQGRANLDIDGGSNHMVTTGTNQVDKFRGKGFVKFDFVDTTVHYNDVAMAKRENIAASARVLGYIKGDNKVTKIIVDDENIFNLDEDTKYIIYLYGSAVGTTADRIVDLTVVDKEVNDDGFCEVHLSADVEDLGGTGKLSENITKGIVMISPYKFWLTLEVNKTDDASHSYSSVIMAGALTNDVDSTSPLVSGFRGATYNESIYNDTDVSGVYSPYINSRSLELTEDLDTILELNKDYGFGTYDKEKLTGGMVNTLYPAVGWNEFILDKVVEVDSDITHDDTLSFMIMPTKTESNNSATIRAKDHGTASSRPYMLTGIFDPLPQPISDFKVRPSKDNAFFPEFTWSTSDSDLWYAFIKVDDKNILNQYHNAILHYPLNETGTHGSTISTAPTENISNSNTNTTIGGATYDIEGLAGYAVNFDGASGTYIRSGTGSADPTASATSNMSVVVHAVHTTASIGGDQYLLNQDEKLIIKAINGGKIEATLHADANSYITLTSSSLVPTDGETPINIILTFDRSIKGNNVKLFINGVLEDQTGARVTMNDGSVSTGWSTTLTQNLNTNNNYLYIGNAANNTATGWVGNIEEVVVYSDTMYPVVPENNKYLFTTPIRELTSESSAQAKTNVARLFIKDFHNIRGDKVTDVRASQNIAWRKAGFALDTS